MVHNSKVSTMNEVNLLAKAKLNLFMVFLLKGITMMAREMASSKLLIMMVQISLRANMSLE